MISHRVNLIYSESNTSIEHDKENVHEVEEKMIKTHMYDPIQKRIVLC